ncbi:MAG: DUF305 domain-containing protein [Propionibacteriaceae bacterium]|nr:DUF305 domain-containing protein [Propionibacteriaceae bacterium]
MTTTIRRLLKAGAGALVLSLALAACTSATDETPGTTTPAASADAATAHNAADTEFAQMMIIHHQGAIEMADLAAEQADTPEVIALAERITAAQGPEIDLMTRWLETWGEPAGTGTDHGGMDHAGMEMDGMDQAEAMAALQALAGTDFDRRFLELMTAHHEGAITMAQAVLDAGQNEDVRRLAQQIIEAQTAEITEMAGLLAGLPA